MKAKDIMTRNPQCCTADTTLQTVAQIMADCNCGEIPVVDSQKTMTPIGVITDRDITCRAVAQGKDPVQTSVKDCMSRPAVTVAPDTSIETCCEIMEKKQFRRIPVVDQTGRCCGIVAQADLAKHCPEHETAQFLKELSEPAGIPSMAAR